jgi:type II secretory pathway pseudopilin PulG
MKYPAFDPQRLVVRRRNGEDGYVLLGVLILLFLFVLAMGIAAPMVAKSIQQDKDEEAVQRGKQYKRALRLYYKKFNGYPASVDVLENTNNIRFLRKRYLDPITGKDDWRLIHVGEAKVPVLGFFGQPLQAGVSSVTTGLAGNGTGGIGNGSTIGGGSGATDSSGGSASGGSGDGSGQPQAPAGVLPGMSSTGTSGASGTGGSTGAFGSSTTGSSTTGGSTFGNDGTAGPIVGFGIPVDKKSLVVYHKQDTYNKWEFTYDPIEEQMYSGTGGLPSASPTAGSGTTGTAGQFGQSGTSGGIQAGGSQNNGTPGPNPNGNGQSQPSTSSPNTN